MTSSVGFSKVKASSALLLSSSVGVSSTSSARGARGAGRGSVMEAEGKKGFGLRMEVTTGGCSGLNYNMSFEKEQKEFDKVFESQGLKIFCDLKSYLYLKGIEIDFSNDILNGGFQIKNPNAERTCGCGTSFSA